MRNKLPFLIAITAGLVMLVQFFVPAYGLQRTRDVMLLWIQIIGAFALVPGVVSLMRVNWTKIRRRVPGWPFALVVIGGFSANFLIGVLGGLFIHDKAGRMLFSAGSDISKNLVFNWVFRYVQVPMDATIFALLAFYIASAAFRSFRARDATATLLLAAATIVMLGRASLTAAWWQQAWEALNVKMPTLGQITEWIMVYPNVAAKRGILFGIGLAGLAQALRILSGIERPYMAGTRD